MSNLEERVAIQFRCKKGESHAYYEKHHKGLTQTQLKRHALPLYFRLLEEGKLDLVPLSFGDPVAYYHSHYEGVSRGQIHIINDDLYYRLRKGGRLEEVPTQAELRYGSSPLAYYETNHPGLTRGDLIKVDRKLYMLLHRRKELARVPFRPMAIPLKKLDDTDKKMLAEYRELYEGVTRGKLANLNRALYQRLRKRNLMGYIPTRAIYSPAASEKACSSAYQSSASNTPLTQDSSSGMIE